MPATDRPCRSRAKASSSSSRVKSTIWPSARIELSAAQGAALIGKTCLPSERAWVISAKHQRDASECSLHTTITARHARSYW